MTHPLQPLNSTQAIISMQSLHLNSRGMNLKSGIMPTVFKSEEKSQTYSQKEERFTVQNKMTDASPIREQPRKARLIIRHKLLHPIMNGPLCKTRKRQGAIETALIFCEQRKTLMNRPDKSEPKSMSFYSTQIPVCQGERSAVQNKIKGRGAMTSRLRQTLYLQSDTSGIRNGMKIQWGHVLMSKQIRVEPKKQRTILIKSNSPTSGKSNTPIWPRLMPWTLTVKSAVHQNVSTTI
jgi:hypothetical protein